MIAHVFEKQAKKRLSLQTLFKIEFLLQFTGSRKVLEKMPDWTQIDLRDLEDFVGFFAFYIRLFSSHTFLFTGDIILK